MSGFVQLRKAAISVNSHEQFTRHTFDEVIMTSPISFELAIDANNALLTQSGYCVCMRRDLQVRTRRRKGTSSRETLFANPIERQGSDE
jgi:hypothetical protein